MTASLFRAAVLLRFWAPTWLIGGALGSKRFWIEMLSAFGYGAASAGLPVLNAEAFIVGALATGLVGPIAVSAGLSLGHTLGKLALLMAIRKGRTLPFWRERQPKPAEGNTWLARWRRWSERTAQLVENPRWGLPMVFVASLTGVPPVYLVCLVAATTRMSWWTFASVLTVGFFLRCYILALLTTGVLSLG